MLPAAWPAHSLFKLTEIITHSPLLKCSDNQEELLPYFTEHLRVRTRADSSPTFQYPYTALPQSALTQGLDRHELLSLGLRYSALVLKNCFHEERLMAHTPSPSDWQTLYVAAMMEADKGMLPTRVNEAEAAIFSRLQELSSVKTCEERTALDDAIRVLRVLKREQLNFPDWT